MTKEDYVSIEVAKMLYQKGFKIEGTYLWNGGVLCPTLYEAAKWLREKHKLHIDVGMCGDYSTDADGSRVAEWEFWTFDMYYTTNFTNHIYDCKGEYDTYEEALNEGILEALKLIDYD